MNPIRRITLWGMLVNILLTAGKFAIGFLAHSQACIADAVHSLSDFTTDIAVPPPRTATIRTAISGSKPSSRCSSASSSASRR